MVLLSDPPQGLKDPGSRGAPAAAALVAPPSSWLSRLFVFGCSSPRRKCGRLQEQHAALEIEGRDLAWEWGRKANRRWTKRSPADWIPPKFLIGNNRKLLAGHISGWWKWGTSGLGPEPPPSFHHSLPAPLLFRCWNVPSYFIMLTSASAHLRSRRPRDRQTTGGCSEPGISPSSLGCSMRGNPSEVYWDFGP